MEYDQLKIKINISICDASVPKPAIRNFYKFQIRRHTDESSNIDHHPPRPPDNCRQNMPSFPPIINKKAHNSVVCQPCEGPCCNSSRKTTRRSLQNAPQAAEQHIMGLEQKAFR